MSFAYSLIKATNSITQPSNNTIDVIVDKIKQFQQHTKNVTSNIVIKIKPIFSSFALKFLNFDHTDPLCYKVFKRNINNPYRLRHTEITVHEWNNRYLNAMPDMIAKLDTVYLRLPDGTSINTSSDVIVDSIIQK